MTIGEAIILGLVQGIAEFLPISSSGHLAILQNLFNMSDIEGGHMLFDVLLHFGTLIAICFMYWNDIKAMVVEVLALLSGRKAVTADGRPKQYTAARMFFLIVAATLPLVLILPINDYIGELSQSTVFVGIALILTGFMLLVSDKMTAGTKTEKNMRFSDALIIGLCQCVATLPGLSRSGTTITAGIATGQNRGYAVKFSLLMSIPAVLGATLLELIKAMVVEVLALLSGSRTVTTDGRPKQYPAARMFFLIVAATLPLVLILPINDYIGELSQSTVFVGIALILTGFMLLVSDKMTQGTKTERNMRFSDALIIGLCQCVATLPGLSRSGTTITAGIATGQNRGYAVKFSLLMSIPAVLGATLLELIKAIKTGIDASLIPAYLFGMVAAMVSGVLAIGLLKMIAKSKRFGGFAYYCWIVGALTIILSMIF